MGGGDDDVQVPRYEIRITMTMMVLRDQGQAGRRHEFGHSLRITAVWMHRETVAIFCRNSLQKVSGTCSLGKRSVSP